MDFKAVLIEKKDSGQQASLKTLTENDLMEGDVTIKVAYSTLNYKDGLALTGRSPVVRRFPMVPGIDFAGTVMESRHPEYQTGDTVILNGWGVGETHWGGYAQIARVNGDWLIPAPPGITPLQAMAIGTAGYTAALCLQALETQKLRPEQGELLVTGAAGGVGSVAIMLAAEAGWHVTASTGRPAEADYLRALGAKTIIDREELAGKVKALAKETWAAAIDTVGSTTLANVLSRIHYGGAVAACGLAGGMDLPSSVAPFILRGVSLLGIDSVMARKSKRLAAWQRIACSFDFSKLEQMTRTVGLNDVIALGEDILAGKVRGRIVVDVNR